MFLSDYIINILTLGNGMNGGLNPRYLPETSSLSAPKVPNLGRSTGQIYIFTLLYRII